MWKELGGWVGGEEADDLAERRRKHKLRPVALTRTDERISPREKQNDRAKPSWGPWNGYMVLHVNDISLTFTPPIYICVTLSNNDYIFFLFY